jgi:ATP phosphoribosyltransferase regulatory subunit
MKPVPAQLPRGARNYLPDEASRKRRVEDQLLGIFGQWGYREIVTPSFEFFDVLSLGTDVALQEHMFKFVDRETGRLLALRADITPQIARVVATRLRDDPKPARLAYVASVFRDDSSPMARSREVHQAGVELCGLDKPEAEVEIIAMTLEGLRALGLHRFQLDLGHPDVVRGLAEEAHADPEQQRALRRALSRKDSATLEQLVDELRAPAAVREALLALPALVGDEDALERAARLARGERAVRAVENLAEVYRLLAIYGLADAVRFDLGEVRGFDYYSGLHFEAYVSGFGTSVAGGGRYDQMLGRFGFDCPAVGFAFDVGGLLAVMEGQGVAPDLTGPDFFIIDFTPEKTAALSLARRLRDLGASVARDIVSRSLDDSLVYARAQRVRRVLVVGSPHTPPGGLLDLELASGRQRALGVSEVLGHPGRFFDELRERSADGT